MTIIWKKWRTHHTPGIGTIRARLMVTFILVVVLATAAIACVNLVLGSKSGRQYVVNQLQSVVTLKQAEIESWVNLLNVNLNLVISSEENQGDVRILNQSVPESEEYQTAYIRIWNRFNFISQNMKLFDELFLMDTDGTVRLSTTPSFQYQKHPMWKLFCPG